jgi:cytochrome c-type biogenesis protein CcmH/NrfF
MRIVGVIVVLSALLTPGRAQELPAGFARGLTTHRQKATDIGLVAPAANETETAIMSDLACTCGMCKREPIRTCTCEMAAKMRGEVKEQLAGADLGTPAARTAAHDRVLHRFTATYGLGVLEPHRVVSGDDRLGAMPLAILGGGLLLFVWQVRRSVRRKRSQPSDRDRNDDDVFI